MFKYECPGCGNVILTSVNDELDCPICYSVLEFKGKGEHESS
jgi:DNA-directed RNA polymerase subunit RPC12/RpoP